MPSLPARDSSCFIAYHLPIFMNPLIPALTPVRATLILSLLLSFVSLYFEPILGRDAAFYIDNARIFVNEGAASLLTRFSWPWFTALIGLTHQATGLSLIAAGYVWIFLLTAGTCALLVKSVELIKPEAAWFACLVALTIPAYNTYRYQILREPGFWFFSALTLVCMILLVQCGRWRYLAAAVASTLMAAVFRLEAVFMLVSIALATAWYFRRFLANHYLGLLLGLALVSGFTAILWWALHLNDDLARVDYYLHLLDPSQVTDHLGQLAHSFSESTLASFSHHQAGHILLFGFGMTILYNAIVMMGPHAIPFFFGEDRQVLADTLRRHSFIPISALIYALVLLVFFIQKAFTLERYTSLLHILLTPIIAMALYNLWQRRRRVAIAVVVLAVLVGIGNVVSTSGKRTHYLPTAEWIQENTSPDDAIYFYDPRISFYSGRGHQYNPLTSEQSLDEGWDRFAYFVVELTADHPAVKKRTNDGTAEILATFDNGRNRALIILGKTTATRE